jgi:hypothetical protein
MVRAAYIIAALLFLIAGLLLWKAFGPAIFLNYITMSFIC